MKTKEGNRMLFRFELKKILNKEKETVQEELLSFLEKNKKLYGDYMLKNCDILRIQKFLDNFDKVYKNDMNKKLNKILVESLR